MFKIPRRYGHFVYGVIQSGLTCAIAAAIASLPLIPEGGFWANWGKSWLLAWLVMLPAVLLIAPLIHRLTRALTRDDRT